MSDLTPEEVARLRELAEAAPPHEPPWPKRSINKEGTCDDCSETKHLVAAYDDPSGNNEPWLCAECAAGSDYLMATIPPTVLALLAALDEARAEVEAWQESSVNWQTLHNQEHDRATAAVAEVATLRETLRRVEALLDSARELHSVSKSDLHAALAQPAQEGQG